MPKVSKKGNGTFVDHHTLFTIIYILLDNLHQSVIKLVVCGYWWRHFLTFENTQFTSMVQVYFIFITFFDETKGDK